MNENAWYLIGLLSVGAVILLVVIIRDKLRTRSLRSVATSFGFTFVKAVDVSALPRVNDLLFFSEGENSIVISNMMYGRIDGVDVILFDCEHRSHNSAKKSPPAKTTVALFQDDSLQFPSFQLIPKNFVLRIASSLGVQGIDLNDAQLFSKHYLLMGENEVAVRGLFRREVIEFIAARRKWRVESKKDVVLFSQQAVLVSPRKLQAFLEEACSLFNIMKRQ